MVHGVRPKAATRSKQAPAPEPKSAETSGRIAAVLSVITNKPEKSQAIAARADMAYNQAWRTLDLAHKAGKVKRVGTQGRDIRWALC